MSTPLPYDPDPFGDSQDYDIGTTGVLELPPSCHDHDPSKSSPKIKTTYLVVTRGTSIGVFSDV